ncbi:uncharacterized protein LOC125261111 isoform X5 [Megalobrama amblycephala]|uniref:uncharacterized protein LOC125261111 isoform X5 n=1 Tax=Megalobrama amblycephala TaxID=75352 RepID=UPI0020142402|nr:uncharacterized protein LOC125261111 isoform X5 [Megalobrama amblycephala]
MVRKKRIKPEQDAKEHILSDKDKAFIEGQQINTFKGRGVFALEHIELSTFVVEYRGILSQSKHVEDVEGNYLFDFTWNGTRYCTDATKVDGSLGRLLNDDHRNPNCKVKTIIVDGRPHLCLFSIRAIFPDEEVTYNYGDSSWPWLLRELCDETSVTVTECSVNPSSSVNEKLQELCDETSVTVTECRVNPSSSVNEKELCDETSVTVTECRVNPSSSVSEKELCDETSVTVTECRVNPSSSVSEKVIMTCKDKSKTVAKKGDSALTGDEMELGDETSVTVTECRVNPSSSVNEKLQELGDETSVTVTECRVNPSSSVSEKLQELCDETSVTVTECRVNPSSSVSEKRPNRGTLKRPWSPNEVNAVMKHYSIFQRDTFQQKPSVSSARLQRTLF